MRAAHPGDNAEAARMIAAFGDLHISKVPWGEAKAWGGVIGNVVGTGSDVD